MFMLNETLVQRQQLIRDVYRTPIIISSGQVRSDVVCQIHFKTIFQAHGH